MTKVKQEKSFTDFLMNCESFPNECLEHAMALFSTYSTD